MQSFESCRPSQAFQSLRCDFRVCKNRRSCISCEMSESRSVSCGTASGRRPTQEVDSFAASRDARYLIKRPIFCVGKGPRLIATTPRPEIDVGDGRPEDWAERAANDVSEEHQGREIVYIGPAHSSERRGVCHLMSASAGCRHAASANSADLQQLKCRPAAVKIKSEMSFG
jgi:hypothetical protein